MEREFKLNTLDSINIKEISGKIREIEFIKDGRVLPISERIKYELIDAINLASIYNYPLAQNDENLKV